MKWLHGIKGRPWNHRRFGWIAAGWLCLLAGCNEQAAPLPIGACAKCRGTGKIVQVVPGDPQVGMLPGPAGGPGTPVVTPQFNYVTLQCPACQGTGQSQ